MERSSRPDIERALHFIAQNLERPLAMAEVARVAGLSEFHFQRVFHSVVGEAVGRFVTRRRLEVAALRLCYEPARSITEIALSSGYSSPSNFSKAFTAYFGCSPTQLRAPQSSLPLAVGKLTAIYGKDFSPSDLYALPPGLDPEERRKRAAECASRLRFETSAGLDFACLSSPQGYEMSALVATWSELIDRARQLGLCEEDVDAWGISHDSPYLTAPEYRRYHACVPCSAVAPLPAPLFRGRMEAGRYAVFTYSGATEGVEAAYRTIYSCWFVESSLTPADFAPIDHYIADWPERGTIELETWFRVQPRP